MERKGCSIGEAAKALSMNVRTIRYYERSGLVKPNRSFSHYRLFREEDLLRLKLVRQLRKVGFSIADTKKALPILLNRSAQDGRSQKLKVFLQRRLGAAEAELRELVTIHKELRSRLERLSSKRQSREESCCEPFCGPETCASGPVEITGFKEARRCQDEEHSDS